eukprot:5422106-Pyramimonas_sp.AAC.1
MTVLMCVQPALLFHYAYREERGEAIGRQQRACQPPHPHRPGNQMPVGREIRPPRSRHLSFRKRSQTG